MVRIEYRPSTLSAEVVCRLDAECFPHEPMDIQVVADAMQNDFWAAWDNDRLVGFACVQRRPDIAWLSRIGTAAACRKRGVATALMQALLPHCRQIGLPETVLYVRADNPVAIKLYNRFGFQAVESTWQFFLSDPKSRLNATDACGIVAVPVCDVPQSSMPRFTREWANISKMHQPPDKYVLIFREGVETVGYCRLNPGFPGCFPFVLDDPANRLLPALCSLRNYLLPEKSLLKLTIWDAALAEACKLAELEFNYELLKMHRAGDC